MTTQPSFSGVTVRKQTLAEQVAAAVGDAILAGTWQEGDALPTEPELGEQFGVSRAVIRDAVRLLMARGLVEVRHGKGMFVTPVQNEAFGEALLLALRRLQATAWDVEEFERMLMPAAIAAASRRATPDDVARLQRTLDAYLDALARDAAAIRDQSDPNGAATVPPDVYRGFAAFWEALFGAAANPLLTLLARPIMRLHSLRNWEGPAVDDAELLAAERRLLQPLVDAIAAHDEDAARAAVARLFQLPEPAEDAMRHTPVGDVVRITGVSIHKGSDS